ncbi:MAG: fused MFS/spermidine synthase [Ectothiorhodospiraceae bacterium]|nr:fused MFS/spermidine synthase [Ectothiorhodospiraceae bacterium]
MNSHRKEQYTCLLLGFAVGFAALIYELYSIQVLFLFYVETIYAVTLTLASFLGGLGISSLVFSRLAGQNTARNKRLLFWMQLALAVYALAILRRYDLIPVLNDFLQLTVPNPNVVEWLRGLLIALFLFVPAFFLGGAFPLINGLYLQGNSDSTTGTGVVYFFDIMGSVLGLLLAGFWLLPTYGLMVTLLVATAASIVTALFLSPGHKHTAITLVASLVLINFWFTWQKETEDITPALSTSNTTLHKNPSAVIDETLPIAPDYPSLTERFGKILFQKQSPFGRITVGTNVLGIPGNKALFINYRDMCLSIDNESERRLGLFATSRLNSGARVLNIGLGCGFTASQVLANQSVASIDIVEINPVVVEAARLYFNKENEGVLESSRTRLHIQDGAEFLRNNTARYNAIIIDIEEISVVYSSPLYTKEYFEIITQRLAPGGILALWAQTGSPKFGKIILNTLREVFSHVEIRLINGFYTYYGSDQPLALPPVRDSERQQTMAVLNAPISEMNTLDNRVLEKYFNIRQFFVLPSDYQERFITSN